MKGLHNFKKVLKSVVSGADCCETFEFKLKDSLKKIILLNAFKDLDKEKLEVQVQYLQDALATLVLSKLAPILYKFLRKVFAETDEKSRQKYFHKLLDWCFNEINVQLPKLSLQRSTFEREIKIRLPLVKLETLIKDPGNDELLENICNYFNSPRLNQEDIYQAVYTYLGSSNYDLLSYDLIPLDQRNGHLGDYFQLKVVIKYNNKIEKFDWFAKFLVAHSEYVKEILDKGPSKKEEFFYMEYLPKLKQLGLSELFDFAPNCYFSRVDDVLILDDLSATGFIAVPPHTQLSLDELKLTLKQLAKFHACSFIFEDSLSSKLVDFYGEYLREAFFVFGSSELDQSFKRVTEAIIYISSIFPDITGKYSKKELRIKADNWCKVTLKQLEKSEKNVNVICHGDMYVANMLFKSTKDQIVQDVKLIDFQLLRYQPPMLDLLFFLYQNTPKETLDENLESLLEEYYGNLTNNLQKYNLDIQNILPRSDFEKSRESMSVLALFLSMYYSSMCALGPELRQDVLSGKYVDLNDDLIMIKLGMGTENYRKVMKGIFVRFIEICDKGLI